MGTFNKLLAAALDMSHQARMARAKELGFDTDRVWYHGTNRPNFDAFDPSRIRQERGDAFSGAGFNFSPSQDVALKYANASSNQALDRATVVSAIRREYPGFVGDWFETILDKGYDAAWTDDFFPQLRQLEAERPDFDINELGDVADHVEGSRSMRVPDEDEQVLRALSGQKERELPHWLDESMAELGILDASPYMHQPRIEPVHLRTGNVLETADPEVAKRAEVDGYDAVLYSGPETVDGVPEMRVFNPANIRSVNAAFDPAKKDSSNLLASLAGAGVLAGAMLPSEDAAAEEERLQATGRHTSEGRPIYVNQWGEAVTERTITEHVPELGGWVNLPTVYDGRFVGPDEAVARAIQAEGRDPITGRQFAAFESVEAAVQAAQQRSGRDLAADVKQQIPATAAELVQSAPQMGQVESLLLSAALGDARPDVVQNIDGSPLLLKLAQGIEDNTQSPLGDSHFQGIVDLLRKWGYREQASPLDYGMAALDVAP